MPFLRRTRTLRAAFVFLAAAALLVLGCASAAGPNDAEVRRDFEHRLRSDLESGAIRIVTFQRASGPVAIPRTKTMHAVAFTAKLECLKPYAYRRSVECPAGKSIAVTEGGGEWTVTIEGAGPVALRQEGKNLTTAGEFVRESDALGAVVSYREKNPYSGVLYYKEWSGWKSAD